MERWEIEKQEGHRSDPLAGILWHSFSVDVGSSTTEHLEVLEEGTKKGLHVKGQLFIQLSKQSGFAGGIFGILFFVPDHFFCGLCFFRPPLPR